MKYPLLITLCSFMFSLGCFSAFAQTPEPAQDLPSRGIFDIPPHTVSNTKSLEQDTHPMIRLTPDKSQLLKLDRDAVSVVVGNPAHLNVLLDTPRILVLIPRAPGASYFSVLDRNGDVIMQRHAIIASPKQNYVRVHRSCINAGEDGSCNATSVYFCPDICHEVNVTQLNEGSTNADADIPEETPAAGPDSLPIPTEQ